MTKDLEDINQDILDIFEEASAAPYSPHINNYKREKHLTKGQDLLMDYKGDFIAVNDSPESDDIFD